MSQARNRILTITMLLALAGCDMLTKPAPGPSGAPASAVPVQEGTISDAMIDLDKSEAQAPLRGGMPTGENLAAEKAARARLGADQQAETAPNPGELVPDAAAPAAAPKPEATKAPASAPSGTPSGFAPKPAPRASARPAAKPAAARPAAAPSPAPKPVRTRGPTFPKPGEE